MNQKEKNQYHGLNKGELPFLDPSDIKRTPEDNGIIFFKNRNFETPEISEERFLILFGENSTNIAKTIVENLLLFLDKEPVGDNFGSDHSLRRQESIKYRKLFGGNFWKRYYERNKFRINILSRVRMLILDLDDLLKTKNKSQNSYFEEKGNQIANVYRNYNEINDLETKLKAVREIEDIVVDVLHFIAGS